MNTISNGLCKAERLNSKNLIEKLFVGESKSFSMFPLRVVFMKIEKNTKTQSSILISVPKKRFKRAVKRNRVKRQVREAYRKNKHELLNVINEKEYSLAIAFIYLSNELYPTDKIEETTKQIIEKLIRKLE